MSTTPMYTDDWSRFSVRQITGPVSVSDFDAVVVATGHASFEDIEVNGPGRDAGGPVLVIDIPGMWSFKKFFGSSVKYWRP